jgi:hypothetical protein
MSLSRFYAITQIEYCRKYCRNFIFKRHFPIPKIFERSCEIGLWRLTANRISEIFGVRLNKRLRGKLATVIDQIEHGHQVFRGDFQYRSGRVIFWVALSIVFVGLAFSAVQFYIGLHHPLDSRAKADGKQAAATEDCVSEFRATLQGIKLKSRFWSCSSSRCRWSSSTCI